MAAPKTRYTIRKFYAGMTKERGYLQAICRGSVMNGLEGEQIMLPLDNKDDVTPFHRYVSVSQKQYNEIREKQNGNRIHA